MSAVLGPRPWDERALGVVRRLSRLADDDLASLPTVLHVVAEGLGVPRAALSVLDRSGRSEGDARRPAGGPVPASVKLWQHELLRSDRTAVEPGPGTWAGVRLSAHGERIVVLTVELAVDADRSPAAAALEIVAWAVAEGLERHGLRAQLREVREARERLVLRTAHDLRSPLATLSVATSTLLTRRARLSTPKQTVLLEEIERCAAELRSSVSRILQVEEVEVAHGPAAGDQASRDQPTRVLCVEDQRTFREVLEVALDAEPDLECAGAVEHVLEALAVLRHGDVDVVVIDFDLPDIDGIEGTRRIKAAHPELCVVILTAMSDLDTYVRAVAAGADGFLAKDTPIDELFAALRTRYAGGLQLDDDALRQLRTRVGDQAHLGPRSWSPDLTDREKEVLALLAAGVDPQTIARQLRIRVHTCRSYVRNILTKLGAHSQLEAVAIARQAELLHDDLS